MTQFIDNSEEVIADIEWRKKKALTENALILEREIVLITPVDTGHLRSSISTIAPFLADQGSGGCFYLKKGTKIRKGRKTPDKCHEITHPGGIEGEPEEDASFVGTNVSYAPHVEYGTKYQKAQSFMRAGYAAAQPKMAENLKRNMKK